MANNLWRDQPSGRIRAADLLIKTPSGVSQLVAGEFFDEYVASDVAATAVLVEAADSLSAIAETSSADITADISLVEAEDTTTAQATVAIFATAVLSQGDDTLAAQASVVIGATAALPEVADTVTAQSDVATNAVVAVVDGADTVTGAGSIPVTATCVLQEPADVSVSRSRVQITAQTVLNEAGDTALALSAVRVNAAAALSESPDGLAASMVRLLTVVNTSIALREAADTLTAGGTVEAVEKPPASVQSAWGMSWGMSWGSAWGAFGEAYPSLTPGLKLFVRTELHKIFARTEAERIIAVAEINNLSVLDAASALSVKVEELMVAAKQPANDSLSVRQDLPAVTTLERVRRLYALEKLPRINAVAQASGECFVRQEDAALFSSTTQNAVVVGRNQKTELSMNIVQCERSISVQAT